MAATATVRVAPEQWKEATITGIKLAQTVIVVQMAMQRKHVVTTGACCSCILVYFVVAFSYTRVSQPRQRITTSCFLCIAICTIYYSLGEFDSCDRRLLPLLGCHPNGRCCSHHPCSATSNEVKTEATQTQDQPRPIGQPHSQACKLSSRMKFV